MPITTADLQLKKSQRLTDTDDGGGLMTAQEVVDGEANNLFPDIGRIDRVAGRVNLRKVFGHVDTPDTDVLINGHLIVSQEPTDPRVHLVMFETGEPADERSGARNFVESYVLQGPTSPLRLYDTQQAGQRTLLCFAEVAAVIPDIGEVLCLSIEAAGFPATQQFVRITTLERRTERFTYEDGSTKDWLILTLGIGSPLKTSFPGQDPGEKKQQPLSEAKTRVRLTQAADAANYYGVSRLTEDAEAGERVLQVHSVYGQIVPATTAEQPVIDQSAAGDSVAYLATREPASVIINTFIPTTRYVGHAIRPGSVVVAATGGGTMRDVEGVLVYDGTPGAVSGTVDYEAGRISLAGNVDPFSANNTVTYQPAARVTQLANTFIDVVELETRRYNYVRSLRPRPAPGTLRISYRALGKWYTIRDNGRGGLSGDLPNTGSGQVNYATGSVVVTLGALPDVGSGVLYAWGQSNEYSVQAGEIDVDPPVIRVALEKAMEPGSLTIHWTHQSTARTATANTAGVISGDATGVVDHVAGEIRFRPTVLPGPGTVYDIDYTEEISETEALTLTDGGGEWLLQLSETPVVAGSVLLSLLLQEAAQPPFAALLRDNGSGAFTAGSSIIGSIDYATGEIALPKAQFAFGIARQSYIFGAGVATLPSTTPAPPGVVYDGNPAQRNYGLPDRNIATRPQLVTLVGGAVTARYREETGGTALRSQEVTQGPLQLDLTPDVAEEVVPGSIDFTFNGRRYLDREGELFTDLDAGTGAALAAGTVSYSTGEATLTVYSGGTGALDLHALLTRALPAGAIQVFFRTPGSPLAVASLVLTAVAADGTPLAATSNNAGQLIGNYITGRVTYETGVVEVVFGDTGPIDDGMGGTTIGFRPLAVDPGTIRYGAVILTTLPLDAEVLGIDPTRLPLDGRVPILRPGQVAVVHRTAVEVLPAPLDPGEVVTLSGAPFSRVVLRDENGLLIPGGLYQVNLTSGAITFSDPLDLSAYQQPLQAEMRIEHLSLLTDVQINGQITLQYGLPADFPAADTRVSAALLVGDLGARVANLFTQRTWTNVWSNQRIGDDSVGKYNDVLSPLVVTNRSAITERWAVIFTSTTAFQVLGEEVGVIATGTIAADTAPINPQTGEPYFVIYAAGWGGGWVANNVVRFNTVSASAPVWIARSIEGGPVTAAVDEGRVELRGDAD